MPSSTLASDTALEPEAAPRIGRSPARLALARLARHRAAMVGGAGVALIVLLGIAAPLIAPFPPDRPDYNLTLARPSLQHLCGTDQFGRDIFSRILHGARISLLIGFSGTFTGAALGMLVGLLSGYYEGPLDTLIMRVMDVLLAFPGILLAIGIIAIIGPGEGNIIVAVAIFGVPIFGRIVRSSVLQLKNEAYIEAVHAIGAATPRVIFRHLLPNTLPLVVVVASLRVATVILVAASLGFLGLGAKPPSPEWGAMLADGRQYISAAPHVASFPGLAILLTVLGLNLLGDGIRDALDPRMGFV